MASEAPEKIFTSPKNFKKNFQNFSNLNFLKVEILRGAIEYINMLEHLLQTHAKMEPILATALQHNSTEINREDSNGGGVGDVQASSSGQNQMLEACGNGEFCLVIKKFWDFLNSRHLRTKTFADTDIYALHMQTDICSQKHLGAKMTQ